MGYHAPISDWGRQDLRVPHRQRRTALRSSTDRANDTSAISGLELTAPSPQPEDLELVFTTAAPPALGSMSQLEHYLAQTNLSHVTDIARANMRADQNAADIENIQEVFRRDFQILNNRIEQLRGGSKPFSPKDGLPPLAKMREQFSPLRIAEIYIEQAEEREEVAKKLREQVAALLPSICADKELVKQIEAVPSSKPAFVCCEVTFTSLEYMLKHVDHCHKRQDSAQNTPRSTARARCNGVRTRGSGSERRSIASEAAPVAEPKVYVDAPTQSKINTEPASSDWRPLAIRGLALPSISAKATSNQATFSWQFLKNLFGGEEWSPGFHFNKAEDCILPRRTYWIVEEEHEPFLPSVPGQHGAKLTSLFNETTTLSGAEPTPENYMDVPVFIRKVSQDEFQYFGQYSQMRYSDKIGYDTLKEHIPESVLRYHADELSRVGRPHWVTEALIKHFWPKPEYDGPIPTDSNCNTPASIATPKASRPSELERHVQKGLEAYAAELKEWKKTTALKVNKLTADAIFKSFDKDDCDHEPGLRMWWEYLQCVGYDEKFYNMLVGIQAMEEKNAGSSKSNAKRPVTPPMRGYNDTDLKAGRAIEIKDKIYPAELVFAEVKEAKKGRKKREKTPAELNREQWKNNPGIHVDDLPPTIWTRPTFDDIVRVEPQGKQATPLTKDQDSVARANEGHSRNALQSFSKPDEELEEPENDGWDAAGTTRLVSKKATASTHPDPLTAPSKPTYHPSQIREAAAFHADVVKPHIPIKTSKNNNHSSGASKRPIKHTTNAAPAPNKNAAPADPSKKPAFIPPHARGK